MSIVDDIERAIREHSDGDAIQTEDRTVSYREFGELTRGFADQLAIHAATSRFIGIEASRGLGAIVAMIGAMRAKQSFVFVDSRDGASSNAKKVGLLGVDLLARSRADGSGVELAEAPADWRRADQAPWNGDLPPGFPTREGEVCYAIHTSGTTGRPKCVLVRTAPLASVIRHHVERLSVGPWSRTLQFARLTFDGCITEILWTLTAGACLVVLDETHLAPGAVLQSTLEQFRITHLKTTPFALTATEPTAGMQLAHVVNGGGACRGALVRKWSAVAAFHNAYGTTETTVCNLLSGELDPDECDQAVPLGDLVGDCDGYLREVDDAPDTTGPNGVVRRGELVITGDSVAVGYLTEHGVQPFGQVNSTAEYRTGDIVELRNGQLYYVERLDRQVKVRGYRLDPGEVENAVCRLDSVIDAVVTVENHDGSETSEPDALLCYYQGDIDSRAVRQHLESVLDAYKVPSVLKQIDAFPYTPNGKVDREALRAIRRASEGPDRHTSSSQQMLHLARSLTGVGDVGLEDNFFEVGGDSASALLLVNKMRELGWVDAGVRDVLRAENLRCLVDQLEEWSV